VSATRPNARFSWLLGASFFLLYLLTASRTVQGGDAGEFATVIASGGVAHPPGYPLFVLLGRWVHFLSPWGSAAFHGAVPAALAGAATVALVHRACFRLGLGGIAAVVAATSLGTSTHFWRYSTVAEVFSLAAFCAAVLVWAAVEVRLGWRGRAPVVMCGVVFAIGLASHHHVATLFPLGVWLLWKASEANRRPLFLLFFATVFLGFVPYLTLLGSHAEWSWGGDMGWAGVKDHLLRKDYGTFSLGVADTSSVWWAHPKDYIEGLIGEFTGVLALLGIWGSRRFVEGEHSGLGLVLAACWLLCGVGFFAAFNLPAEGFWEVVSARFWLVPNVIFALWVAVGTSAFLRLEIWRQPSVPAFLLGICLSVHAAIAAQRAPHHNSTWLEDYLHNSLQVVEQDAVIFGTGDSRLFGMLYVQEVQGLRPDVSYVAAGLLGQSWYRNRLLDRAPGLELEGGLAERIRANLTERPVYLSIRLYTPELSQKIPPAWPVGAVLMKVKAPGEALPAPDALVRTTLATMQTFEMTSRPLNQWQASRTWEYEAWDQYALGWERIANAQRNAGNAAGAAFSLEQARELSPWLFD
jgi:hypothetical protein